MNYLTQDELECRERLHVRRDTVLGVLVGGAAFLPILGFAHARLEAIAQQMPPGAFESLWRPVIPTLFATGLGLLLLVRTATRHWSWRGRRPHEKMFARHRAATLERLFNVKRTT